MASFLLFHTIKTKYSITLKKFIMNLESKEFLGGDYEEATGTGSNDLSKVLIGALAGAAVGSLIGGSFTTKGVEIRNRVGEGSKNIAGNLKDKVSDMKETIADKYEAAKEGASDLIEKGKQKVGMAKGSTNYKSSTAYGEDAGESDETIDGSKILLGALIASAAGILVWGFATDKGTETRKRLAKGSKSMASTFKEKVSEVAGDLADTISDTYETAKEGAADLLQKELQKSKTPSEGPSFKGSSGTDNW